MERNVHSSTTEQSFSSSHAVSRLVLFIAIIILSSVTVFGLDVSTFTPAQNAVLSSSTLSVEVFIDAPLGNTVICDYKTNQSGVFATIQDGVTVTAGSVAVFESTSLSDDLYQWSVNCTDTTDSATAQTGINRVTLDTTAPDVTLVTPTDGTVIEGTNDITFTGSATDSNPGRCILYTDYNGSLQAESVSNSGTFDSFLFTLSDLDDTSLTWDVKCTDDAGNDAFSGDSYSVEIDYVNDAPQIGMTSPQNVPHGVSYSRSLDATDPNPSDVLDYYSSSSAYVATSDGRITNADPTQSENVTVTVCDDSDAANNCTSKIIEFKVRQPIRQLNITQPQFGSDLRRFNNYSATITLENTGDFTLSDIEVLSTADSSYQFNVTGVPSSLDPGESASLDVTITVPEDIDSGENEIGYLYIRSENIVYDTEELIVDINNELIVSDLDITGRNIETYRDLESDNEDIEVHPGDTVDISFEVENGYTTEQDIMFDSTVATLIIDSFGDLRADDDLEYEFGEFKLDPEDHRTLKYSFTVPYAIEDDEEYEAELEIIAEDEEGNKHSYLWTTDFIGVRDSDEVHIFEYELSDTTIECVNDRLDRLRFRAEIMSLSDVEQENMYAELYVEDVDDTLQTYEFTLSEDPTDSDNTFIIDHVFTLDPQIESGKYFVYLDVYSDFTEIVDRVALSFELESCQQVQEPVDDDDDEKDDDDTQDDDGDETQTDPVQEEDPEDDPILKPDLNITEDEMRSLIRAFTDEIDQANYTITKQSARVQNITGSQATVQTLLELSQSFSNETIAALEDIDRLIAENRTAVVPMIRTVSVYTLENSTTEKSVTEISYAFVTKVTVSDAQVIELIPTTYAQNTSVITYGTNEPVVLDSDPALQWNIRRVRANTTEPQIRYYLDGDQSGFSASTIGVADGNAAFFVDYLPFIGIMLGIIILLGGLGFGTVIVLRSVLSEDTEYSTQRHPAEASASTTYHNIYQEGSPARKTIQLPGLPEIETEVDPVSGRIRSDLEL